MTSRIHRPVGVATTLVIFAFVTIGLGTATGDGIWMGWGEFRTEHHGGGAPDHPAFIVQVPGDNWGSFNGVDLANATVQICAKFAVTALELEQVCESGDPCWPLYQDWDKGKVKVTVKDRQTGRTLTKLVAKYKDGETGWVCKNVAASAMEGVTTVLFSPKGRQMPKREAKVFMEGLIHKPTDRISARNLPAGPTPLGPTRPGRLPR